MAADFIEWTCQNATGDPSQRYHGNKYKIASNLELCFLVIHDQVGSTDKYKLHFYWEGSFSVEEHKHVNNRNFLNRIQ